MHSACNRQRQEIAVMYSNIAGSIFLFDRYNVYGCPSLVFTADHAALYQSVLPSALLLCYKTPWFPKVSYLLDE
jgi:hypothetical protein